MAAAGGVTLPRWRQQGPPPRRPRSPNLECFPARGRSGRPPQPAGRKPRWQPTAAMPNVPAAGCPGWAVGGAADGHVQAPAARASPALSTPPAARPTDLRSESGWRRLLLAQRRSPPWSTRPRRPEHAFPHEATAVGLSPQPAVARRHPIRLRYRRHDAAAQKSPRLGLLAPCPDPPRPPVAPKTSWWSRHVHSAARLGPFPHRTVASVKSPEPSV